jgi:thiol-disulfide isomerase/thioredoxin
MKKIMSYIAMYAAGMVLLAAAFLKVHQLLSVPIQSKTFFESWLFYVLVAPLEIGLGIWLCCNLFRKAGWLLGTLAYLGFFALTLYRAITGAASCGCFGTVQINPWLSLFAVDVPILLLLVLFPPKGERLLPPPWPKASHFFGVAIPTFIILPAVMGLMYFNKPPEKTQKYEVVNPAAWTTVAHKPKPKDANMPAVKPDPNIKAVLPVKPDTNKIELNRASAVVYTPADPNAREWEMLKSIDIAQTLRSGTYVVLLYHYDCPNCKKSIPEYDRYSKELGSDGDIKFVFIEVPPYGTAEQNPVPKDTTAISGKLDSSKKWYFETPIVALIENGKLIKYWQTNAPTLDEILAGLQN